MERLDKQEREARRFKQIAGLERELQQKAAEITSASDHVKDLKREYDGTLLRLRAAARDEGELPLLDMIEDADSRRAN